VSIDRVLALLADGRLVVWIIALMVVEAAVLLFWRARTGGGLPVSSVLSLLASGVFLMLAVRAALTAAGTASVAAWLLAALVAHVVDLLVRWQRPSRGRAPRGTSMPPAAPQ
jgi:uncharacterized membrane protein YGL010W